MPLSLKEIKSLFRVELMAGLKEAGFKGRRYMVGKDFVGIVERYERTRSHHTGIEVNLHLRCKRVTELARVVQPKYFEHRDDFGLAFDGIEAFPGGRRLYLFDVGERAARVCAEAAAAVAIIRDHVVPLWERCSTIDGARRTLRAWNPSRHDLLQARSLAYLAALAGDEQDARHWLGVLYKQPDADDTRVIKGLMTAARSRRPGQA